MQLGGPLNLRVPRSGRAAAVSGEPRFPPAFMGPVFGPGNVGRRPSGRRPDGCGGPCGDRSRPERPRQSRSGDGEFLRKRSVRHRKPGCPADLGFRTEGAGRSSTSRFSTVAAPPPRVGAAVDPGPCGLLAEAAQGLAGRRRRPARGSPAARKTAAPAAVVRRPDDRRCACRPPPVRRGFPRESPPRPEPVFLASREVPPSRRTPGPSVGSTREEGGRPDRVSSLPSGRSATSLRFIGHARPGIRARMLIRNLPAAAITSSWNQLLRRREYPLFRGTSQRGASPAAPGASLITAATPAVQPNLVVTVPPRTRCGPDALEHITVGWNRPRRSIDRVHLLYSYDLDRIHVIRRNRGAGPPDHDPV
jgi:hypothetical protein